LVLCQFFDVSEMIGTWWRFSDSDFFPQKEKTRTELMGFL
jgi:hypothetical protein